MNAREWLLQRQQELKANATAIDVELSQIARALRAMNEVPANIGSAPPPPPPPPAINKHPMPVNEAIVLAVEAGMKTPTTILAYLAEHLGVHTTLNSVRSRVSPLGQEGRIGHDGSGWIPPPKPRLIRTYWTRL